MQGLKDALAWLNIAEHMVGSWFDQTFGKQPATSL